MEGRLSTNADSASVSHHLSFHPGILDELIGRLTRSARSLLNCLEKIVWFLATGSQKPFTNPANSA